MTHNQLVRGLQVINHVLGLIGLAYVFMTGTYYLLLVALITYWVIGVLGINIGMHRLLSHRSFKTHPVIEKILSIFAVWTTVGSPLAWVAIHRQHHRSADKAGDPHSPYILGNWRAWFGFWNLQKLDVKLINDLRKNKFQKFLHKHYLACLLLINFVLLLINPWLVIFMYCIPASLCLHSSSAIIVIAHRHGYKSFEVNDESRNSWIASLITLGEGWHNNHHARPYDWNNQYKWWEFDVAAWIIRLIKR